jgi:threonine dehydrogenase-like Zn-dependent dehydrogenase
MDTAAVIVNEITLIGSRCGRFEPAIDLLKTGKINVASLLAGEFPLRSAPAAFAAAARAGTLKVLLRNT